METSDLCLDHLDCLDCDNLLQSIIAFASDSDGLREKLYTVQAYSVYTVC